ncbi:CHAT domain-containing protein [Microcoleus vaginatus GB2-A3]|uniref:CHAT domain-containing protein n=1 Tax=Microcoleus vaginatus TaxID=119532 RepID=UPI0032A2F56C
MDEQRLQAYLNLIQSLLNCPSGKENQILQANSELVDAGLVQVMQLYAENQREEGNQNTADFLTNLASYIVEVSESPSANSQLEFLLQVLRVTAESGGDHNVIHPLLRDNLNLVNDNFAVFLRNWVREALPNLDSQEQISIIGIVATFSDVIWQFPVGSRASNWEIAIAGYEVALNVYTRQEYAEYWAQTQHNLGNVYGDRIRGEKAENLEIAITAFLAALSVYTRKAFPFEWAMTQNSLGLAYRDRIRGEKAHNLEMAIAAYREALLVLTRKAFPFEWAMTQNNLGLAYYDRIRGEKAHNLEMAIAAYQEALSVDTRKAFPQRWAITQNNLGLAYIARIRGEKADNLEMAIAVFQASLGVLNREAFPQDWAMTQNSLAAAYRNRIRGKKADNLEKAISAYRAALSVRTREAFPQGWADTQNDLGNAYGDRIRGEKAENLEMGISAYRAALSVRTRKAFPQDWAMTQNNLGYAYINRIRGEKAENLEMAISASQAALSVYTREAFPINHAQTLYNLGVAYGLNSQLPEAYNTLNTAIETVESMRSEIIVGGEADRQKLAEEYNKIYQVMVEVCLVMENKNAALEYIERSKTRNLVELFHNARSEPKNVRRISFQEIRRLLGEDEAILEWCISQKNFKVFIITPDSTQPDIWESSYQDLELLEKFQQEYIDDIKDEEKYENWKTQLETRMEKLAEILHIDEIISRLPENCQRLILVPFRYLHLLPLHALTSRRLRQNVEETGCLLELFPGGVRYTPSCQLLQLSQRVNPTGEESSPTRLFAIQNPTEDLDFTDIEVEAIAKSFNPAEVLIREKASKTGLQQQLEALQNADIAHFSCHGFFDFLDPRKSALILAGAKITTDNIDSENKSYIRSRRGETFDIAECLTLEEIFNWRLSKCSLVTLSACETGLTDIRDNTDEYIGLPSGFFYAGATSVISTLWAVNDVSTAILMIKFYELFLSEIRPPVAIALRESQLWLRSLTVKGLLEWVEASKLLSREHKTTIQDSFAYGYDDDYQPYEAPHFWAAFCAVGQ